MNKNCPACEHAHPDADCACGCEYDMSFCGGCGWSDCECPDAPQSERLPWGDMPYDGWPVAEVIHEYVVIRGDLSEQYARDQLTEWIERYADHRAAQALRDSGDALDALQTPENEHYAFRDPALWLHRRAEGLDEWVPEVDGPAGLALERKPCGRCGLPTAKWHSRRKCNEIAGTA